MSSEPFDFDLFSPVKTEKLTIEFNEHYKEWNPEENLLKLKSKVHDIIRVSEL